VRAFRLLFGFLLCLSLEGQTDARLWQYLHPDAKAVIGVNWTLFRQSVIWTMLEPKMGTLPLPIKGLPSFMQEIDRVLLSSPGGSEGKGEPPILLVVHGQFGPDAVRKALMEQGAHKQIYGKFTIYRPQAKENNQDLGFVIVDSQTVLIGDIGSLCGAVDRSGFTPVPPGPTLTRAAVLDSANDFWAVISNPSILASDRLQGFFAGEDLNDLGRGLEFGMSFHDGFVVNISLKTASEAAAKHLSDQIYKAVKLSAKDKPTNAGLAEMEKKLKVAPAGDTVAINLHLTREEVERSTRLYQAAAKNIPPKAPVAALNLAVETPPQKPQPQKMVIRIEGLDGGTREVPFNH
jgi:hypothetical protein